MSCSLTTDERLTDIETSSASINPGNQSSGSVTSPVRSADGPTDLTYLWVESGISSTILMKNGREYICSFFDKFLLQVWLKL
jgi:hypothetical protein